MLRRKKLDTTAQVMVYRLDNFGRFEIVGELDNYSSIAWGEAQKGCYQFEIWAPVMKKNQELLQMGNIIHVKGRPQAGIINIKDCEIDDSGIGKYHVKGLTAECLLDTRILMGLYLRQDTPANIIYDLVDVNCVNPVDMKRKIPFLELDRIEIQEASILYQKTGGSVYDSVETLSVINNLGYCVDFDARNKKLLFGVYRGTDRTIGNSSSPVVLSTTLENLLDSKYYQNRQNETNVAFVQGEGKDEERKSKLVGEISLSGFDRKELYVDARDLQSEYTDSETNEQKKLTESEYLDLLNQRGNDKILETRETEQFESKVKTLGKAQFVFNEDYFLGDKITVIDERQGLSISTTITQVEEVFGESYSLSLTFGFDNSSLSKKLRQL